MKPKQVNSRILAKQIQKDLEKELGKGPLRFGPAFVQPSVQEQIMRAPDVEKDLNAFAALSANWDLSHQRKKKTFTDEQMIRILRYKGFNLDRALGLMRRMDPRHFQINSFDLKEQLESKTLFPVPGLKTLEGSNCFYMRPCRYRPDDTATSTIIENLIYVMDTYAERDPELIDGIAFIANMNDWAFENFSTDYCRQFMQVLQGRKFPAKVNLFLIVNPPKWFGKIWNIMKPMLSSTFQRKVHMISEDELGFFFKQGYERFLPDEFLEGEASTDQLVEDFIAYRMAVEVATGKVSPKKSVFRTKITEKRSRNILRMIRLPGRSFHEKNSNKEPVKEALEIVEGTEHSSSSCAVLVARTGSS
jgi:hypothetical protein